ncbi:MAG: PBP1A family penicillin-binding protein [Coriobacteriia bacterium]|nr:PBP1A family penicillin-binding protein [Coriobacteriia bacterium]
MSTRRRRARRSRGGPRIVLGVLAAGLFGVLTLLLFGTAGAYGVLSSWLQDLPDYESPDAFEVAQTTRVYSADGVLLARLYLENRTVVPMSAIATDLVDAVVAVEDERFYSHDGIDLYGIARAAIRDIVTGSPDEGASTITQQYIRNTVLLDERTDISLARKVREAFLARELEKRKSKDEILELYLNAIYFGEGAYGAQAAAQTFFSKDANDLTLPEAALLAGLPQQPSRLSPYANPEGATRRRNLVLSRMLANGYITAEEYAVARETPLELKRAPQPADGIYAAPYFVAHVKKLLQREYSPSLVFEGGLEVHTTIDMRMQAAAEKSVSDALGRPEDPDTALVSIDPRDGFIKAMVGGRDFETNKFNLATQGRRQPGSSFKTFVLVAALEAGMPPSRYVDSSSPARIPTTPVWEVSNSEGRGRGFITMDAATRSSVNTVFARLIWELNDDESTGAEKVANVARRMGITSAIPPYPSIALGSQNVTPLEMASAFGTLATNGVHYEPVAITKVIDRHGDVVFEADPEGVPALEPEIAGEATTVLRGVITGGTARRADIGRPAAGKTGTSQNYRDAWFVGYTPDLVTSVWVGFYQEEKPMLNVRGRRGFGGTVAAPIWADFMKAALEGRPKLDFEKVGKPEYTFVQQPLQVPVPDLVGMTLAQARTALEETGLGLAAAEVYHDTAPAGTIVTQSPAAGSSARPNDVVSVQVSKGKDPTPPPAPEPKPAPEPPPPSDDTTDPAKPPGKKP